MTTTLIDNDDDNGNQLMDAGNGNGGDAGGEGLEGGVGSRRGTRRRR